METVSLDFITVPGSYSSLGLERAVLCPAVLWVQHEEEEELWCGLRGANSLCAGTRESWAGSRA